jgi:hypothetical protein
MQVPAKANPMVDTRFVFSMDTETSPIAVRSGVTHTEDRFSRAEDEVLRSLNMYVDVKLLG